MKSSARWWSRHPKFRIAAIAGAAIVLLLILFDWNWLRHPLERFLSERAHRSVRIDDLHVSLGLEPTVRLRGVRIQNAVWAQRQPMADVGEVSFTLSLRSVWDRHPVVSRLVLSDANVQLEKLADGRRNWRLTRPDDTGPPRVRILIVEAHRSKIEFVEHRLDLHLLVVASDAAASDAAASNARPGDVSAHDPALNTRVDFGGSYKGVRFSGMVLTKDAISFQESGAPSPVRGAINWAGTRVELDGNAADILKRPKIDGEMRITGSSLADLYPFLSVSLPASNAYRIEARLKTGDNRYELHQLHGNIGETDVSGDASYQTTAEGAIGGDGGSGDAQRETQENEAKPRRVFRAELHSDVLDFADLGPPFGVRKGPHVIVTHDASDRTVVEKRDSREAKASDNDRVLPARKLELDRFRATEAHVGFDANKLRSPPALPLESLRFKADLKDGVLAMSPIDFGLAGGHATGAFTLDARADVAAVRATVDFRRIQLDRLFPKLPAMANSAGVIGAQIRMEGRGASIAAILANASGSFTLAMDGGRISSLVDAETALNGGKMLSALIGGRKDIAIRCAALAIDFHYGNGRSRILVFDTEDTHTDGSGTVDLRNEKLEFVLHPTPKHPTIFSLRAPVRLQGSFRHAGLSVDKGIVVARAAGAVLLAAVNPFATFVPLLEKGDGEDGHCAEVLGSVPAAEANRKPQRRPNSRKVAKPDAGGTASPRAMAQPAEVSTSGGASLTRSQ